MHDTTGPDLLDWITFEEKFNDVYAWLYDRGDKVRRYSSNLNDFAEYSEEFGGLVRSFENIRGEKLSTNRQRVAFMMTLRSMLKLEEK